MSVPEYARYAAGRGTAATGGALRAPRRSTRAWAGGSAGGARRRGRATRRPGKEQGGPGHDRARGRRPARGATGGRAPHPASLSPPTTPQCARGRPGSGSAAGAAHRRAGAQHRATFCTQKKGDLMIWPLRAAGRARCRPHVGSRSSCSHRSSQRGGRKERAADRVRDHPGRRCGGALTSGAPAPAAAAPAAAAAAAASARPRARALVLSRTHLDVDPAASLADEPVENRRRQHQHHHHHGEPDPVALLFLGLAHHGSRPVSPEGGEEADGRAPTADACAVP